MYWGFESVWEATYSLTDGDMGPADLSFLWLVVLISEGVWLGLCLCDECDVCDECLEGLEEPFDDDWGRSFVDDLDGFWLAFEWLLVDVEDSDTFPSKGWGALR